MHYDYYSEIHNRVLKTKRSVRATPEKLKELLPLLDELPFEQKEYFELVVKTLLYRLQNHYNVWSKVLAESQSRKPTIRRIK